MPTTNVSPVLAQVLLQTMILTMDADPEGEDEEIAAIGTVWGDVVGGAIDPTQLAKTLDAVRANPAGAWEDIKAQRGALSPEEKDLVIKAVVRIVIADAELQEAELNHLTKLARALDIPGQRLRQAMNEAWKAR